MDIDYGTAKEVKINRTGTQVSYMPFYTIDQSESCWMNGCLWNSEQEAIDSVKYDNTIRRLRIMKIELPVLNVSENVEIGTK